MYNEGLTVRDKEKESFELAFKILFHQQFGHHTDKHRQRANGYTVKKGVLFISRYSDKCTKFAYDYNLEQTTEFAWGWWQANQDPKESEPDTDGSTDVGFEITTDGCGVGSEDWGLMVAIRPVWFEYGK